MPLANLDIQKIVVDHTDKVVGEKTSNTAHYNVVINKHETDASFTVTLYNRLKGFVKVKNDEDYKNKTKTDYSLNYTSESKTLTLTLAEPMADIFISKHFTITFSLPNSYSETNMAFEANTNSGNITIGDTKDLTFNSLNLKSKSGEIIVTPSTDVLNDIYIENNKRVTLPELTHNFGKTITIKSNEGKIICNGTKSNLNIETNDTTISLSDIGGNVNIVSKGSLIMANKISGNLVLSDTFDSGNIQVNEVVGEVNIPSANTANITIGKISGNSIIRSKKGTIKIDSLNSSSIIATEKGSISFVAMATASVTAISTSGSINAKYLGVTTTSSLNSGSGAITCRIATGQNCEIICNSSGTIYLDNTASPDHEKTYTFGTVTQPNSKKINLTSTSGKIKVFVE